jgi:hypothetical protein
MKNILVVLFFVVFAPIAWANVSLDVVPNRTRIQIGEQVELKIKITIATNQKLSWPIERNLLNEHVEIIEQSKIDTSYLEGSNDLMLFQQTWLITSFDSGLWAVEPLIFMVDGEAYESEAFLLTVDNIELSDESEIKDIKDIEELPYTFWEIAGFVALAILILLILLRVVALIIYLNGQDASAPKEAKTKEQNIPIHEWMYQVLNTLEKEKLWQNGNHKEYHIRLSEIIRNYIEKCYHIQALEITTSELELSMRSIELPDELRKKLIQSMHISDLSKFAKATPLDSENIFAIRTAYELMEYSVKTEEEKKLNAAN